jgi:Tfp pilus assembly protein FimT
MALIAIVLGMVMPTLSRFFRGRTLDLEARRFLSLTRYGQSRAISEGVPMLLWMDAKRGAYGLKAEATYTAIDTNAIIFSLDPSIMMQVAPPVSNSVASSQGQNTQVPGGAMTIHFRPDGLLDDSSPARIVLRQNDFGEVWILQSLTRLNYEISTNYWNRPR